MNVGLVLHDVALAREGERDSVGRVLAVPFPEAVARMQGRGALRLLSCTAGGAAGQRGRPLSEKSLKPAASFWNAGRSNAADQHPSSLFTTCTVTRASCARGGGYPSTWANRPFMSATGCQISPIEPGVQSLHPKKRPYTQRV